MADERRMTPDSKLEPEQQRAVSRALEDAANYIDEEVTPDRVKNSEYYHGEPFGNEQEGRSKVVSQDVRDTVHAILPSLIRVFCGTEQAVEFVPESEEDVEGAQQSTDYVNHVFQRDNKGFLVLHSVFKDALIRRSGVVKSWWDDAIEVTYEDYEGLDDDSLMLLTEDDEVEIVEQESYPDKVEVDRIREEVEQLQAQYEQVRAQVEAQGGDLDQLGPPPEMPPEDQWPMRHDVQVKVQKEAGRLRAMALPPEEVLVSKGSRSLTEGWRDGHIVAHRTEKTVGELVAMGYDRDYVLDFAPTDELDSNAERTQREPSGDYDDDGTELSELSRRVLYTEAWVPLDLDDDDIPELRKVCCMGDQYTAVYEEPASFVPLADFCPDPEPHVAIGRCPADVVRDIQLIKSNITRGVLDSLAQSINPRTGVVEGEVNMDDALNNEVGGIVRMRRPGMVQPLDTPFVGQQALPILDYMDRMREKRTGITDATQGLNADVLQSTTKAAVTATVEASQQQTELIARIFAETGMRDLFRNLLRQIKQYQNKPRMVRLRNEFVTMDPATWRSDMDAEPSVAVSSGSKDDRMNMLATINERQKEILLQLGPNNPLVTLGQYAHTLNKMVELAGFKDTQSYFNALPLDYTMPQAPGQDEPSPEMVLAQVQREEIQANIEKKRAEIELDRRKAQEQMTLDREEMLRRDDRERDRQEAQVILDAAKMRAEHGAEVDVYRILDIMNRKRGNPV